MIQSDTPPSYAHIEEPLIQGSRRRHTGQMEPDHSARWSDEAGQVRTWPEASIMATFFLFLLIIWSTLAGIWTPGYQKLKEPDLDGTRTR